MEELKKNVDNKLKAEAAKADGEKKEAIRKSK